MVYKLGLDKGYFYCLLIIELSYLLNPSMGPKYKYQIGLTFKLCY